MNINVIARICHNINKVYCESIGDMSQVTWEDCPDWQKISAIKGIEYLLDTPDATSKSLHDNWVKQKESEGWVYGNIKDIDKKEHPCMLAYEQLSAHNRIKDSLFITIVRSAL